MPIYSYFCSECHESFDVFKKSYKQMDEKTMCSVCSSVMKRNFSVPSIVHSNRVGGTIFPVNGITLKNLPGGPKHFKSYKAMKRYEKKNNLSLGAVL